MHPFQIEVLSVEPPSFRLVGELDLDATGLCEEVIEPRCEHRTTVDLDLSGITFVDSTGLRTLVRLHRICDAAGGRLRLRHLPEQAARVFEVCRLEEVLCIEPDGPALIPDAVRGSAGFRLASEG